MVDADEQLLPAPTRKEIRDRVFNPRFPRSNTYDPVWQMENMLGTNPLWLTESLAELLTLRRGMRVLDLGCGRGMSALFLAREYGVQVWAADLWTNPDENWARVQAFGLDDVVFPLQADAYTLPFASDFFDAVVSVDAWQYFGTSDDFVSKIAGYLKPDGKIAMISPGLTEEFREGLPEHMIPFWQQEFWTFHSAEWWRTLWQGAGSVDVLHADMIEDGWKLWMEWEEIARDLGYPYAPDDISLLQADEGEYLGFVRLVATKRDRS